MYVIDDIQLTHSVNIYVHDFIENTCTQNIITLIVMQVLLNSIICIFVFFHYIIYIYKEKIRSKTTFSLLKIFNRMLKTDEYTLLRCKLIYLSNTY